MIASITGQVAHKLLDRAVIVAGGVGYEVYATPATLSQWQEGADVTAHTYQVVREDALNLYGFATWDERTIFSILIGISGIGPKLALAALSVHTPDSLRQAIANEDETALLTIPGVGKKSAKRLIVEIGTKLGPASSLPAGTPGVQPSSATGAEVVNALVQLGWSQSLAQGAVAAVGEGPDMASTLRQALQYLGSQRG